MSTYLSPIKVEQSVVDPGVEALSEEATSSLTDGSGSPRDFSEGGFILNLDDDSVLVVVVSPVSFSPGKTFP